MSTDAPAPAFVSADDLAQRSGLSRSTVYNMLKDGRLRSAWFQNRRLIPSEDADRFIEELRSQVQ